MRRGPAPASDVSTQAAARALAAGDALGALKLVALRDDAAALALRGTAMAQLGELGRARELLRGAARAFGAGDALARARCVVAEAEVALAMRDLGAAPRALAAAAAQLDAKGDRTNANQARLIALRRLLLLGRLDDARTALAAIDTGGNTLPATHRAVAALAAAEIALRSLRTADAAAALAAAGGAAAASGVAALVSEIAEAATALQRPAARRLHGGHEQPLRLAEVEALQGSGALLVDACSRVLRAGPLQLALAGRPLLFALARALAEAWPGDAARDALIARVFRTRHGDETHRARLRVEIGRLRALLRPLARIVATPAGFVLEPLDGRGVAVIVPPIDGEQAALQALLADGAAWSTSALAQALGASQRSVQRALAELEAAGRVRSIGRSRSQRWLAPPLAGFTTILLLPAALQQG